MPVTLSGGVGTAPLFMNYDATAQTTFLAEALATTISQSLPSIQYYSSGSPATPALPDAYLVIPSDAGPGPITAINYRAIIVENNTSAMTVFGGGAVSQIVLSGNQGLH
ncbi:MAG: hypothetical protein EOO77_44275, partial [Oxalobacteraceae bacterium]